VLCLAGVKEILPVDVLAGPVLPSLLFPRCSELYTPYCVGVFRRHVRVLTPIAQRKFCQLRMFIDPRFERGRQYFVDAPELIEEGLLMDAPRPYNNTHVCSKFFCFITGKSTNFLYQPSQAGAVMRLDISQNIVRPTPKEDAIVLFLLDLRQYYQLSPDNDMVFLPFPRRQFVWQLHMDDCADDERCRKSYFLRVWRTNPLTRNIKLRKHLRFALCDECIEFRELTLLDQTAVERAALKIAQVLHHRFVKWERQLYYIRRARGCDPAVSAMSMIVDAADQSDYAMPYFYNATHSSQKCFRVPTHLMGVLVHGEAVHAYTYYETFKQGNNVTIEAIHEALAVKLAKDGALPDTLYLQLDNTSKQCKGRYMIGFLGFLILLGLFKHIVLSFLPVGHTHEDIDQVFSRLSVYLECHNALNVVQLHDAVRRCYQTRDGHRAITGHWDRCANFSHWIKPYLNNYDGISMFRQFRFSSVDGEVRVQSRKHTSDRGEWAGIRGDDAWTAVFKKNPPLTMRNVPATQRRDLVTTRMMNKHKKSITKLMAARRVDLDVVDSVMAGVDTLGDEAPLPFAWDLSRVINFRPENADMKDDGKQEEESFDYVYELNDVVLLRPLPGSETSFWIGRIAGLGDGVRSGEYQVWWLSARRPFGTYSPSVDHKNEPVLEWQFQESIQDTVVMISQGRKLSAASVTAINHWIDRWAQEAADNMNEDENPDSDSESGDEGMLAV
jgi:hypothetical protein